MEQYGQVIHMTTLIYINETIVIQRDNRETIERQQRDNRETIEKQQRDNRETIERQLK